MKKSNIIPAVIAIFLVLLAVSGSAFASTPEQNTGAIRDVIKEAITYPSYTLKNGCEGTVDVTFTLAKDGAIQIKTIDTENEELGEYVKEALEDVYVDDYFYSFNKHYKVTLKFQKN